MLVVNSLRINFSQIRRKRSKFWYNLHPYMLLINLLTKNNIHLVMLPLNSLLINLRAWNWYQTNPNKTNQRQINWRLDNAVCRHLMLSLATSWIRHVWYSFFLSLLPLNKEQKKYLMIYQNVSTTITFNSYILSESFFRKHIFYFKLG